MTDSRRDFPGMTKTPIIENVLLVDDEREFVNTVAERLQTREITATVAHSGEAALSAMNSRPVDVVVLDLKMPGMDGMEVLKRIRTTHPDVEVIMLTGHGSAGEERTAVELGVFAYLSKPQNIDFLAKLIRQAYDRRNPQVGRRCDVVADV